MNRNDADSSSVTPSIALLQERFRNLERMKQKRLEKEKLERFSETERFLSLRSSTIFTQRRDPGRLMPFQYYAVFPDEPSQSAQDSPLSLVLNSLDMNTSEHKPVTKDGKHNSSTRGPETSINSSAAFSLPMTLDASDDIDTSLHL